MSRRRGEMTPAAIDRGWPHQIALNANFVAGENHAAVERARAELGGCPRGHFVRHADVSYVVYCFADKESAAEFRQRFGGEPFDPKYRGRGRYWWKWKRPGSRNGPPFSRT